MEVSTSVYAQTSTLHHAPLCSYCRRVRAEMGGSLTSILNQNGVPKGKDVKIQDPRAIIDRRQVQEKLQSSLKGLCKDKMHYFTLACPQLPPVTARPTASLTILVPLIVLCARSIISASYVRVFESSRLKTVSEREGKRHMFRNGHWRSALRDLRELDDLDLESTVDSTSPQEEEQVSVEELSRVYKTLDQDYKRFLSECGLSK